MQNTSLPIVEQSGFPFQPKEMIDLHHCGGSPATAAAARRSSEAYTKMLERNPNFQEWRDCANEMKRYSIRELDSLLEEFERNLKAKGVDVFWARDAQEANNIIIGIAKENHVKKVVKSKSLVSEELQLNRAFEKNGIEAIETDLGEYLLQLAGQRPTHTVVPALHLTADDCGRLFQEKLGEPYTNVHEELTSIARKRLREHFLSADMGVSGVNFGIADTGSFVVIENEGNAGLSTSTPSIHVAIMGIEKVIPSIDYLPQFLHLLPRSATDQKLTTYTHLFQGPSPGKKMTLVIIDNGRTNALAQRETESVLYCIRCGACMNACPVYHRVGGWAYGWIYPGPIGAILNPHLVGMEQAGVLPFASSLCEKCTSVCPVKVEITNQLVYLRSRATSEKSPMNSTYQKILWRTWSFWNATASRYRFAAFFVRLGTRLARWIPRFVHVLELRAWTQGRAIPRPEGGSFRAWFRKNQPKNIKEE
ncbi:MAG: lactate utilization protein B [Planctomycetia bacterium]|nr:lactate utilization protein B [Planctomycetia bacterium]